MALIFNEICDKMLSKTQNLISKNKVLTKVLALSFVLILSLFISFVSCGVTLGFKVIYNGASIGVVQNREVFDEAVDYINANTENAKVAKAIKKPSFSLTLTVANNFVSEDEIVKSIVKNTDEIVLVNVLYINDKVVAHSGIANIEELVEEARCRYYIEGAENSAEFIDVVRIEKAYCSSARLDNDEDVREIILNLDVKTVSKVSSEYPIDFSTKTVKTATQYIGYSKITTAGIQGIALKTELVETLNGQESSRELLKNEVLVEPVTQVVLTGTAVNMATPTEKAQAQAAGLILPLNTYEYISAYWGDGRNHKAIDFAGKRGTAIFAAQGGVVTCAAYRGNYGYLVEIDHGNGLKTRYAHCDAMCVKEGQIVSQGDQIATMGNTGRSTGDHLHFEVLKNGDQVNPYSYILK